GVAPPAPAALGGEEAVALVDEVGEDGAVALLHLRADGDRHDEVLAPVAVTALALAVGAAAGGPVRVVLEGDQRRHVVVGDEPHVAARTAVAAVRPALGRV